MGSEGKDRTRELLPAGTIAVVAAAPRFAPVAELSQPTSSYSASAPSFWMPTVISTASKLPSASASTPSSEKASSK